MLDLSIIIVSWNVEALLVACLNSIYNAPHKFTFEVIVVDSASSDHTVLRLEKDFPQVRLFAQSENVGYTKGNNIGLAQAQAHYMLLLNPDTEIIGDALGDMISYLVANPTVGIVGPHTLNTDLTTQSSRRLFPTPLTGFFESTWLQPYAPKRLLQAFYVQDAPDNAVLDVDWVQGSALMARRRIYEQIGGLDEGFVMYCEELDWCKRAKSKDWRVVFLGTAQIVHHGGKSSEQIGARKHIHFQESKLRYFHKHHGVIVAFALRVFLLMSYGVQLLIEGAKWAIGHKRELRCERVKAYWQVLKTGLPIT